MAQRIKGITVEIGGDTQPLNKALKDVSKTAASLNSELRIIDKLLKLDPTNTTLLAQKQEVLAKSIENTTKKLNALKSAQEQAKAQLERGEIGADQYRVLERQVISTENSLNRLQNEAQQTDEALNNAGDAAQKTGKDMNSLSVGGVALGTVLGNVATKLLEFAGSAVTFLTDAVEETKEFRSDLSKLEQNAKAAGTGIDDVTDDLEYFVAITDETDSSVEALSNLLKAGFTGETLTDAVNNLSGAVVAFPDTLKIESLADSLQETLATGEATGQYGELLERLGVNLEDFNKGLQKCTTSAEKQQYAVDILAKNGMADLNAQYKEANADLIAYSTAQTRYTEMLSKVGAAMQPVMTALTDTKTLLLEGMIPALETTGQALSEKLASPSVQNSFKKLGEGLAEVASAFANFAVFIIENGEMIIKIIGSIAAGFVAWKISSIIQSMGGLKAAFQAIIPAIKNMGKAITAVSSSTIIGALVTVASIIATIAESFLGASDATETFKDEMASLKDEAEGMATEFAATQETLAINGETMRGLVTDIQALDSSIKSGNLSAAEMAVAQGQLAAKTAEYNAAAGEEVLKIDAATGAIDGSTSALADNTEALIENARKAAEIEALQKAFEAQTEAQAQQATQLAEIDKYYDQLSDEQKKYIDQMKEEGVSVEALSNLWYASPIWGGQVNNEIRGIVEGLEDSIDAEKAAGEQAEYYTEKVGESAAADAQRKNAIDETNEALSGLGEAEAIYLMQRLANNEELSQSDQDALDLWKSNNAERAAELEEQLAREKEIYQARVDAATDMNNKIDLSNQTSLKQATENLEHNTQVTQEMVANLDSLYGKIPESLYTYLEEAGTDQARLISQLANEMEGGGSDVATRFVNAYLAAINAGKSPAAAAAYAFGSDTPTSAGQGIDSNKAAQTEFESAMQETADNVSAMIGADGPFYWLGIGIINRLASGMRDMAWKLYDVADNVVSTLKSKFNFEISVSSTGRGAKFQGFATGGIISREQIVRVAERGPEAIIPLDRLGGIIQGVLDNNGGGSGGNTYQLNVYTSDLSDGAQVRLFKNFSKWAGRRLI
jgi:phage-related minor tail protein